MAVCEECGSTEDVKPTPCRTAYERPTRTFWNDILEEEPPNPNVDPVLCPDCTLEYHAHWDEMWAQVPH